jgi:hypothetical protein
MECDLIGGFVDGCFGCCSFAGVWFRYGSGSPLEGALLVGGGRFFVLLRVGRGGLDGFLGVVLVDAKDHLQDQRRIDDHMCLMDRHIYGNYGSMLAGM